MSFLELYDQGCIYDAVPREEYEQYFYQNAIPAFYESMTDLFEVDDEEMRPLITVLNLLGIRTTSCCSGHTETMAFVCIEINTIRDFDNVHRVLTDLGGGQLEEFSAMIGKTFEVRTLQRGMRVDLAYTPREVELFGVWLWFQAVTSTKLKLGWGWKTARIMARLRG